MTKTAMHLGRRRGRGCVSGTPRKGSFRMVKERENEEATQAFSSRISRQWFIEESCRRKGT